jgi:hypothetical protein
MPEEPINPFGPQPPQLGGLASLTPQEGQEMPGLDAGSFYSLSPEVLSMMWGPQQQPYPPQPPPEVPY